MMRSLNPLHCGAVVASPTPTASRQTPTRVSIPFIAGQWSLRSTPPTPSATCGESQSPSLRGSGRFDAAALLQRLRHIVSQSPSLRGSGRFVELPLAMVRADMSVSIPFIAGQWSLHGRSGLLPTRSQVSIPFIAGQWSLRTRNERLAARRGKFQSPSLRGSGRFGGRCHSIGGTSQVSIPFIAGQWSLRRELR